MQIPFTKREGKKGLFVFRRRVPLDLVEAVGASHWKVHLHTRDEVEAFGRAAKLVAEQDALTAELRENAVALEREKADAATRKGKIAKALEHKLASLALARSALDKLTDDERAALDEVGGDLKALLIGVELGDASERLEKDIPEAVEDMTPREKHAAEFDKAEHRKARGALERLGVVKTVENTDDIEDTPDDPRLSTVLERWLKHVGQRPETAKRHRKTVARFIEIFGNMRVKEIGQRQALAFRDAAENFPDARLLPAKDRGLPIKRLQGRGLPVISARTVSKHLDTMRALLNWCVTNVPDFGGANAFMRVTGAKDRRRQKEIRRGFTPAEARRVLDEVPRYYCGIGGNGKRYRHRHEDMRWLIPLLAFSGLRLEEACQLDRTDVYKDGDVWAIRAVWEGEKTLKNFSSERVVPVHPYLIEHGFVEWATTGKGARVFSSFVRYGVGRKLGGAPSSSFNRFLTALGMKEPQLVAHSFRHSFVTACRNAQMPYSVELALLGKADSRNASHGDYGDRPKVSVLAEWIAKVDPLS